MLRKGFRSALLVFALAGCASRGGIPVEPFPDIPVPASFVPYSDQWALIRTPRVTAAKLVYMTSLVPDAALAAVQDELVRHGWTAKEVTRFVNPQGFRGMSQEFVKGSDACRATAIEGPNATHVDLAVARRNPQ
ncbi:MAG: hypothetical protein HY726_09695 [Candidatus Rokubacteria bacterium]|nr:hypothetical protein [Candidatus Rokubacteria bacterium]